MEPFLNSFSTFRVREGHLDNNSIDVKCEMLPKDLRYKCVMISLSYYLHTIRKTSSSYKLHGCIMIDNQGLFLVSKRIMDYVAYEKLSIHSKSFKVCIHNTEYHFLKKRRCIVEFMNMFNIKYLILFKIN